MDKTEFLNYVGIVLPLLTAFAAWFCTRLYYLDELSKIKNKKPEKWVEKLTPYMKLDPDSISLDQIKKVITTTKSYT